MKQTVKSGPKLETFARQYVILNFNGTRAAIAAGYSKKTADRQAWRLLRNAKVRKLIAKYAEPAVKKMDITVERTLTELARCAYIDPRTLFRDDGSLKRITELNEDTAACVAGVEMGGRGGKRVERLKLTDKLRALNMLGNYLKLFTEDRNPVDLGVKVIVLDMPRPPRPVAAAASTQLSLPETRSDVTKVNEYVNQKAQLGFKPSSSRFELFK